MEFWYSGVGGVYTSSRSEASLFGYHLKKPQEDEGANHGEIWGREKQLRSSGACKALSACTGVCLAHVRTGRRPAVWRLVIGGEGEQEKSGASRRRLQRVWWP